MLRRPWRTQPLDAYGHIHQEVVNDNHDPDNTGAVLYSDILFALALYATRERLAGRGSPPAASERG
ncbi:MAG: DUF6790 family protein [Solirubrobacterales bacterium]